MSLEISLDFDVRKTVGNAVSGYRTGAAEILRRTGSSRPSMACLYSSGARTCRFTKKTGHGLACPVSICLENGLLRPRTSGHHNHVHFGSGFGRRSARLNPVGIDTFALHQIRLSVLGALSRKSIVFRWIR